MTSRSVTLGVLKSLKVSFRRRMLASGIRSMVETTWCLEGRIRGSQLGGLVDQPEVLSDEHVVHLPALDLAHTRLVENAVGLVNLLVLPAPVSKAIVHDRGLREQALVHTVQENALLHHLALSLRLVQGEQGGEVLDVGPAHPDNRLGVGPAARQGRVLEQVDPVVSRLGRVYLGPDLGLQRLELLLLGLDGGQPIRNGGLLPL
mmetsp:Transcript_6854/g.11565  ORF Transcript_6854/g.11565 Transcript_6854/m.11565 type:complete len:204 (+) Transcript_6854:123-734(+)